MMALGHITVNLFCFARNWRVLAFSGVEELSECYRFNITIITKSKYTRMDWLDQQACLSWRSGDDDPRYISGVITSYNHQAYSGKKYSKIVLVLEPRLKKLSYIYGNCLWEDKSCMQILQSLLQQLGIEYASPIFMKQSTIGMLVESPNESKWQLMWRLLANHGLYFWFQNHPDYEKIVFCNNKIYQPNQRKTYRYLPLSQQQNDIARYRKYAGVYEYQYIHQHIVSEVDGYEPLDDDAIRVKRYYQQAVACQKQYISLETFILDLYPALVVSLDIDGLMEYQIIAISHVYKNNFYHNKVKLIPFSQQYRIQPSTRETAPAALIATINDAEPGLLDQAGRQAVRYDFLQQDYKNYPYCPRATPFSANSDEFSSYGFYAPLQGNTSVVMGFLYGDINRPIILAALMINDQGPSNNRAGAIWTSYTNHQTQLGKQISLMTNNDSNKLVINEHGDNRLQTNDGEFHAFAEGKIVFSIRGVSQQNLSAEAIWNVQQNLTISSRYASVLWQSDNIEYAIASDFLMQSGSNLEIQADQLSNFEIKNKVCIAAGEVQLHCQRDEIWLEAQRELEIISTESDIILGNVNSGLRFSHAGELTFWGDKLSLAASNTITIDGLVKQENINFNKPQIGSFELHNVNQTRISQLYKKSRIYNLHWQDQQVSNRQLIYAKFNLSAPKASDSVKIIIYYCEALADKIPYHGSLFDSNSERRKIQSVITFPISEDSELQIISLNQQQFNLNATKQVMLKQASYFRFSIQLQDDAAGILSPPLSFITNITLNLSNEQSRCLHGKQFIKLTTCSMVRAGYNTLKLVEKSSKKQINSNRIIFSRLRVGQLYQIELLGFEVFVPKAYGPWCYHKVDIPLSDKSTIDVNMHYLQPPIMINTRKHYSGNAHALLSADELNYFAKNGNNICIFVHGFNVPHGEFGFHIDKSDELVITDHRASVYRDPAKLAARHSLTIEEINQIKNLNANGAHQWLINLEYHLNRCHGFAGDYRQFSRIVLFSWHGDPESSSDFVNAVEYAKVAAAELQKLIMQIYKAKPTMMISLVSHSLGAGVVSQAMEGLAIIGLENIIKHVYLWQPAIPQNALSPLTYDGVDTINTNYQQYASSKEIRNRYRSNKEINPWKLAFAHRATRNITILYSKNDNILGPISHKDSSEKIQSCKPAQERVISTFIDKLQLSSIYDIAMWIGKPVDYFFESKNRKEFFTNWVSQHPVDRNDNPFPKTLKEFIRAKPLHDNYSKNKFIVDFLLAKLNAKNYSITFTLSMFEKILLDNQLKPYLSDNNTYKELGAIYELIRRTEFTPSHALGWCGPDEITIKRLGHKLSLIDQTTWLYSHSAMLEPNAEILSKSYKQGILATMSFGQDETKIV